MFKIIKKNKEEDFYYEGHNIGKVKPKFEVIIEDITKLPSPKIPKTIIRDKK